MYELGVDRIWNYENYKNGVCRINFFLKITFFRCQEQAPWKLANFKRKKMIYIYKSKFSMYLLNSTNNYCV